LYRILLFWNLTSPFRSLPRRAELLWPVSRYLWRG
jgi:hypothetical protein